MKKHWYFQRDGTRQGPFTADEMRAQAVRGILLQTDLVWREGMTEPVEARLVPTLFTRSVPPPTTPEK